MPNQGDSVVILGGGTDQLPAIRAAHEIGLNTIVFDRDGECAGRQLSTSFHHISSRDPAAICSALKSSVRMSSIRGIFVMGTDIPHIAADIAQRLGVNYPIPLAAANLMTDKFLMKNHFIDHDIPAPSHREILSVDQLLGLPDLNCEREGTFVLKPRNLSGARGVFLITPEMSKDTIVDCYREAAELSNGATLLLEEFVLGPQISSESLVYDGNVSTPGFALRNYEFLHRFSPNIIENGGIQPSTEHLYLLDAANSLIKKIADSLNIESGVIKGDLVFNVERRRLEVIEVALRLSGGNFCSDIIPISCGFDFVKNAMKIYTGESPIIPDFFEFNNIVANRYFFEDGEIGDMSCDINPIPEWVLLFEQTKKKGSFVKKIASHADRTGVFVVCAPSQDTLNKRVREVYSSTSFSR